MIDFLKEVGIEEEVIKDLELSYSEANLYNLNSHEVEVLKIINYFREIGIEYIDELLIDNLNIFFLSYDEIVVKFNKYNISKLVETINYDYMLIDKFLFD